VLRKMLTHLTETVKSPTRFTNSSFGIFFDLNFGGPSSPINAPNTLASGHTPSYVHLAEPVLQDGFH
jgi:hypothetical protein